MHRLPPFVIAATLLSAAQAVNIQGTLGNPGDIQRLIGRSAHTFILFASYTQAAVVGRAEVKNGQFYLDVPDGQALQLHPYRACDGVRLSAPAQVYQTETILLYSNELNRAIGPVLQADRPKNPSKVVQWLYSDRAASVQGQCSGLNTRYDLQLRKGWTAVLSVSRSVGAQIGVTYTNASERLPYWVSGDLRFDRARSTLPAGFFRAETTHRP